MSTEAIVWIAVLVWLVLIALFLLFLAGGASHRKKQEDARDKPR
jgi:flagellar basal body-associated protein FliL